MPIVLRIKGYRFGFYASDCDEPPHVHIRKDDNAAKYWLKPMFLKESHGFRPRELKKMERIIADHLDELMEAWNGFFKL